MPTAKWPLRIYWIKMPDVGRIAVMPRPMLDQFDALKQAGVDVVVSLLQPEEAARLGLGSEDQFCHAAGMHFLHLPVLDHSSPKTVPPVEAMSKDIRRHLAARKGVAFTPRAGGAEEER